MKPTWDHALQADGPDDEIFMRSVFTWIGSDGKVAFGPKQVQTPIYGRSRIQIPLTDKVFDIPGWLPGSRGGDVGIYRNDVIPGWGAPWLLLNHTWKRSQPGQPFTELPYLLYEWVGPIDQITGTVTVMPSVWEMDTGKPLDTEWGKAEIEYAGDLAVKIGAAAGAVGAAIPPLAPLIAVGAVIGSVGALIPKALRGAKDIVGEPGDRPIGQVRADDGQRTYDQPLLTIDLAKAAQAAAHTQGYGPGIYVIPVKDSANIGGGEYEMFLGFTYEIA